MATESRFRDDFDRAAAASRRANAAPSAKTLTEAVSAWQGILDLPGIGQFPGLVWHAQTELGNSFLDRFDRLQHPDDLDAAIACYQEVLANARDKIDYRASLQGTLGGALLQRYGIAADPCDLEDCIIAYGQSLIGDAVTGVRRERILTNYGLALYKHYLLSHDLAVLNTAIEQLRKLESGEDIGNRAFAESNLGIALRARFMATGDPADLDESIAAQAKALHSAEPGSFNWAKWLCNLGNALYNRFELLGQEEDLEDAIAAQENALEALTRGSEERAATQLNLGTALVGRFDRFGDLSDLEAAIAAFAQVHDESPPGSGKGSLGLSYLANALRLRFFALGSQDDLDAAAEIADQVLAGTRPGTPAWFTAQSTVGMVRRTRFGFLGQLPDLERALKMHREVLAGAPAGSHPWALGHFGLGETLLTRYKALGDFADLEAAIESFRNALVAFPTGTGDHAGALASLGAALDLRYQASKQPGDVEESIALHRQALATVRPGSLKWIRWQTGLGIALSLRYDALGQEQDLQTAVSVLQDALGAPQQHGLDWASAQIELGSILIERYRTSKRSEDLDQVVTATDEALAVLPQGSGEWSFCQEIRADAFRFRFAECGEKADLELSAQAYQQLLDWLDVEVWPERIFAAASGLAELNGEHGDWDAAAESWRRAIGVTSRLYQIQLGLMGREAILRRNADIHERAAYAYARVGLLQEAVVTLEMGRARAFSDALARDRADLERVRELDPDGYELYVTAANRVRQLEAAEHARSKAMTLGGTTPPTEEAMREEARSARAQLQTAISRIRTLSGYEDFLAEPAWEDIARVLDREGSSPLVYLVSSFAGGMALVVEPPSKAGDSVQASVEVLWLDEFTGACTRDLLSGNGEPGWAGAYESWLHNPGDEGRRQAWFDMLDATARRLWDLAMEPIVALLRSRSRSHAVLIPTFLLPLLPFHAAWTEDATTPNSRSYALDAIGFTYAPNAGSLRAARAIADRTAPTSILVVADPRPTRTNPLPNAEGEVQAAVAYFPDWQVLVHEQATREAVIEALPEHSVVHFSCHGRANVASPLESGLLMAGDELLSVQDFFAYRFHGIRLAILSACETNLPGLDLPDETISLPMALLQAGVAGIAASLWSVEDLSTLMLMVRFYDFWRKDRLEPAEALRQAQIWVRDTTSQRKADFFKDSMPKLFEALIFLEPHKYTHPFYWAAFTYVGI
jgi:CHAT domain-containing protein